MLEANSHILSQEARMLSELCAGSHPITYPAQILPQPATMV